jgi:hypothetical protein
MLPDIRIAFGHDDAPSTLLLGSHEELQHLPSTTANPVSDLLRGASVWINGKPTTKLVSRFPAADYPLLATCSSTCRNRIAVIPPLRHRLPMGCNMLATFREANAFQATMPAVGLLRFATTQNGRFRARRSRVTPDRLRPASYRSVTELTLRAVDVRIVGVQNRDDVRPSIETRSGKATRRDLRARRWRS